VVAFNNYKLVRGGLLIADQWRKKGTPRAVSNLPQDTEGVPEDRALVGSRMIGAYQGDPSQRDLQPFSGEGRKPGLQTHISANAVRRKLGGGQVGRPPKEGGKPGKKPLSVKIPKRRRNGMLEWVEDPGMRGWGAAVVGWADTNPKPKSLPAPVSSPGAAAAPTAISIPSPNRPQVVYRSQGSTYPTSPGGTNSRRCGAIGSRGACQRISGTCPYHSNKDCSKIQENPNVM